MSDMRNDVRDALKNSGIPVFNLWPYIKDSI